MIAAMHIGRNVDPDTRLAVTAVASFGLISGAVATLLQLPYLGGAAIALGVVMLILGAILPETRSIVALVVVAIPLFIAIVMGPAGAESLMFSLGNVAGGFNAGLEVGRK